MKKIFLYLIIISFYFSCNKENYVTPIEKSEIIKPIQMPKDFSFEFNYFTDSYNSKTKKFKRNYQNGNKTIKVELNKNELEEIYKLFKNNNFEKLPNNFENENILIIDDIIIGGGSCIKIAEQLLNQKCHQIFVAASHITIAETNNKLWEIFDKVFTSNSKNLAYKNTKFDKEPLNLNIIKLFNENY